MFTTMKMMGGEEIGTPGSDGGSDRDLEEKSKFKLWHIPFGLVVLFSLVCIPILFVMIGRVKDSVSYVLSYRSCIVRLKRLLTLSPLLPLCIQSNTAFAATATFAASTSVSEGKVVSLDSSGGLQHGGGTSIYKNIVDVTADCPSYLSMDSVFGNTYIISYANKETHEATLQIVNVDSDSPNVGTLVNSELTPYYIYDIASLNTTAGTFVGVCQDLNNTGETAYLVAGKIDPTTYAITLVKSDTPYADSYSVNPAITRLSDTNFAVVYYNSYPAKIATRYGKHFPY
jgi:hypothetical protein